MLPGLAGIESLEMLEFFQEMRDEGSGMVSLGLALGLPDNEAPEELGLLNGKSDRESDVEVRERLDFLKGNSAGDSGTDSSNLLSGLAETEGPDMLGLFKGNPNGDAGVASLNFPSGLPETEGPEILVFLRGNPNGDSGAISLSGLAGSDGPETPGFLRSPGGGVRIRPTGVTSLKLLTRPISTLPRD